MFEIKLLLKNSQSSPSWLSTLPSEFLSQADIKLIYSEDTIENGEDYLIFDGEKLFFRSKHPEHLQFSPVSFDFDSVIQHYREEFMRKSKKQELLYRAFNFKTNSHPTILDATCGTGKDALTLWFFGARVIACERNPVVFLLLTDALSRSQLITENFNLHFGFGSSATDVVDMIYFDPMFPEKKKSALPSKEMQVFKYLVGSDDDQVLEAEKLKAKNPKRLVIKRPINIKEAPALLPNPSMNYESKLLRLDCYL